MNPIKAITGLFASAMMLVLLLIVTIKPAHALYVGNPIGLIQKFCGSYASAVKTATGYELFSNAYPDPAKPCPGAGCPGITRYTGATLLSQSFQGTVAPNSIINDVFDSSGNLAANRMFSRPHVDKFNGKYYATAWVMNGYPPNPFVSAPVALTSSDGVHWNYLGKFKGEPFEYAKTHNVFGSGMALLISDVSPKFRFFTDAYGVKIAELRSDDFINWTFVRNATGGIKELAPSGWTGFVFGSVARWNNAIYLVSGNSWPVQGWQFAKSVDNGNTFVDDYWIDASGKTFNFYLEGTKLFGLVDYSASGSCNYKGLYEVLTQAPPKKRRK